MLPISKPVRQWSNIGVRVLISSIVASVIFALLDGYLSGPALHDIANVEDHGRVLMFATWMRDFRYLADQAIYASTIFIVGAKFIETRTIFSVGFDKADADRMRCRGPDEDNIVWIGRRYDTRLEAESVAATFQARLKQDAETEAAAPTA